MEHRDIINKWEQFKNAAEQAEKQYNIGAKTYLVYATDINQFTATSNPIQTDDIIDTLTDDTTDGIGFLNLGHAKYTTNDLSLLFGLWCDKHIADRGAM